MSVFASSRAYSSKRKNNGISTVMLSILSGADSDKSVFNETIMDYLSWYLSATTSEYVSFNISSSSSVNSSPVSPQLALTAVTSDQSE